MPGIVHRQVSGGAVNRMTALARAPRLIDNVRGRAASLHASVHIDRGVSDRRAQESSCIAAADFTATSGHSGFLPRQNLNVPWLPCAARYSNPLNLPYPWDLGGTM